MKILVVGNSHVGSLKRAWEVMRENAGQHVEIHFVAARANQLSHLKIENQVLYSDHENTSESIEFTFGQKCVDLKVLKPDAILFYGLGLKFHHGFFSRGRNERYSSDFLKHAIKDLTDKFGFKIASAVARETGMSVFISSPLPALRISGSVAKKKDAPDDLQSSLNYANREIFGAMGLRYFLQPTETIDTYEHATKVEFARGSRRLAVGDERDDELHEVDDLSHMNDDFGRIFLSSFISACSEERNKNGGRSKIQGIFRKLKA